MNIFLTEASFWNPEYLVASAWIRHAPFGFWIIDALRPALVVELGTHLGFSFEVFNQALKKLDVNTLTCAVDTWKGDEHSGFYGPEVYEALSAYNYERYGDFSELIQSTFDEALGRFEDGTIDLLHIDGRHFYEDVKHDFECWRPKMSHRGIVLLHDTNVSVRRFGVHRLWRELRDQYPHFEFKHEHGLGVLGVGSELPDGLRQLFAASSDEGKARTIRRVYSRLGDAIGDPYWMRAALPQAAPAEVTHLREEIGRFAAENERVRAAIAALTGERDVLSQEKEASLQEKDAVILERASLRQRCETLEQDNQQLAGRLSVLDSVQEKAKLLEAERDLIAENFRQEQHQRSVIEAAHSDLLLRQQELKLQLETLQGNFGQLEKYCQSLEQEEAAYNRDAGEIRRALGVAQKELSEHKTLVAAGKQRIADLDARMAPLAAENTALSADLLEAKLALRRLQLSKSWRATAPFRALRRLSAEPQTLLLPLWLLWFALTFRLRSGFALYRAKLAVYRSGLFDPVAYTSRNPDVVAAKIDPLTHYVGSGGFEGRDPNWLFSSEYYLAHNPDVAAARLNPLVHFVKHGAGERRKPHPLFDTDWYIRNNPDVVTAGLNPLWHYIEYGGFEGRDPNPFFDSDWYLTQYPPVRAKRINPLIDYVTEGWQAGRNPSPDFETSWYIENYPDVAKAGLNPLAHYIEHGRAEGRHPRRGRQPAELVQRHKVVFVSGEASTPGHRYRVADMITALASPMFETVLIKIEEIAAKIDEVRDARILYIWRAGWSQDLATLIETAKWGGAKVVFDVDDLMFRPEIAVTSVIDGIRSMALEEGQIQQFYSGIRRVLEAADHCTTPTAFLAQEVRDCGKPCTVIPNGFDAAALHASKEARLKRQNRASGRLIRIGYAAGSRTHQKDLAIASKAIANILADCPAARLVLFKNCIDLEEFPELQPLKSQIEWRDLVPLANLPFEYARFDINIAPLEAGNRFCESKSELKFFEAALVGVPTIASPTEPYRNAIRHGENGMLARDTGEWAHCLTQLVFNEKLRKSLAEQAYTDVLWSYGPERRKQLFTRLVTQLLSTPSTTAEIFRAAALLDRKTPPPITVPDYDVIFTSPRRGFSRVAVVVPLFNYAHLLPEALESVRRQTIKDLDLIVVDDCSTDHSLAVARDWLERHASDFHNVALLKNRQNSKLGATRNAAITYSDAEFVLPLDPDNLLLPHFVERCLHFIEESGAAFAYPTIEVIGERDARRDRPEIMGIWSFDPALMVAGNYIDAMALIRKACWLAVGGYTALDPMGWEDFDFWCKLIEAGMFGVRVPEIIAQYRVHVESMLNTITNISDNKIRVIEDANARHPWLRVRVPARNTGAIRANGAHPATPVRVRRTEREQLLALLRCPVTGEPLRQADAETLITASGSHSWPIVKGRPVFTADGRNVVIHPEGHISNEIPPNAINLIQRSPGWVLNLSAGGSEVRYPNIIELEYSIFRHTDLVGDVHTLPFQDEVFDAVVCMNAFEHYREPEEAMAEVRRVLKPGGKLLMRTAFLQPLHEPPYHFYNCTEFGLRHWLKHFEIDTVHVSDNFNPIYTLSWITSELECGFGSGISPEAAALFRESRLGEVMQFWRDPRVRNEDRWKIYFDLPEEWQRRLSAGWEAVARKS